MGQLNQEAIIALDKIKETENQLIRDNLINKKGNKNVDNPHNYWKFKIIRSFARCFANGYITLDEVDQEQSELLN